MSYEKLSSKIVESRDVRLRTAATLMLAGFALTGCSSESKVDADNIVQDQPAQELIPGMTLTPEQATHLELKDSLSEEEFELAKTGGETTLELEGWKSEQIQVIRDVVMPESPITLTTPSISVLDSDEVIEAAEMNLSLEYGEKLEKFMNGVSVFNYEGFKSPDDVTKLAEAFYEDACYMKMIHEYGMTRDQINEQLKPENNTLENSASRKSITTGILMTSLMSGSYVDQALDISNPATGVSTIDEGGMVLFEDAFFDKTYGELTDTFTTDFRVEYTPQPDDSGIDFLEGISYLGDGFASDTYTIYRKNIDGLNPDGSFKIAETANRLSVKYSIPAPEGDTMELIYAEVTGSIGNVLELE